MIKKGDLTKWKQQKHLRQNKRRKERTRNLAVVKKETECNLDAFYHCLLNHKHVEVYDDEGYLKIMNDMVFYYLTQKQANNSFRFCKACYSFVTRKMLESYDHHDTMTFERWKYDYWEELDLLKIKELAKEKGYKYEKYWKAPGFTRAPCVLEKPISDKPQKKTKFRSKKTQTEAKDFFPAILSEGLSEFSFSVESEKRIKPDIGQDFICSCHKPKDLQINCLNLEKKGISFDNIKSITNRGNISNETYNFK